MIYKSNKSNKKFMLLSALGIIFVVDAHCWGAIGLFSNAIPYDSFFMPMFVFVSGYFNKVQSDTDVGSYIAKKVRTLLIPYTLVSVFSLVFESLFDYIKNGSIKAFSNRFFAFFIIKIFTNGSPVSLCNSLWFVISLFFILVFYALIKKALYKKWNNFLMFFIFCLFHLFVVYFTKNNDLSSYFFLLLPLKCMFFFPFVELGIIYREYIEKWHVSLSSSLKIVILIVLLLINIFRQMLLPQAYDIAFNNLSTLTGFISPYIFTPMISSIIGIAFWLTVVELIGKPLFDNRLINYISDNTFWIMGFHLLMFNLLNILLLIIDKCLISLPGFDLSLFKTTNWYRWEPNVCFKYLYFLVGVFGSLALKYLFDKAILIIKSIFKKRNNSFFKN